MIKKLLQNVGEYKTASILAPVCVSLEVLMEVLIPLLMIPLVDDGIEVGNMDVILRMGVILLVLAVVSLIFGVLSGRFAATASAGFGKNLRRSIFYRVQDFSFSNIDKFSTAGIVTRLTTDVSNVQMAYQMVIRMAVRSPVMLIFSLIMAFQVNDRLAWIFVAFTPVLGIGMWLLLSRAHPIFERVFKTYDKLNNVVQENLRGIRVVKSFNRESFEEEKFQVISQLIYGDFSRAEKLLALAMPLMQFCLYAGMLLVSWFGAKLIVTDVMTTGELMNLMSYAMQILMSLMMLSMVFVMLTISRASAERIVELLEEESDIRDNALALQEVRDGSLSFTDVSFAYGKDAERPVLENITVDIPSGSVVGILGGTGSSKTSLVQLIPRLYDVSSGSVKVGGADVRDYHIPVLRDAVAMVLQKNVLFSGTIRDNLRWGDEQATDEEIQSACRIAQAHEFISAFPQGYDTYLEQGGVNVSGGQKQRLCIARALLKKPKILILDDSTSAVDTKTDAAIRKALRKHMPHTTKVIIAQRVSSVMDADVILLLESGRIAAMGRHEEMMQKSETYREIWKAQQKGEDEA